MTSIKDKLTSSVRQAKNAAEPAGADKARTHETSSSAATRAAAHETSSSAATKAAAAEPAPDDSLAGEPPSSLQELFPDRIWPD